MSEAYKQKLFVEVFIYSQWFSLLSYRYDHKSLVLHLSAQMFEFKISRTACISDRLLRSLNRSLPRLFLTLFSLMLVTVIRLSLRRIFSYQL